MFCFFTADQRDEVGEGQLDLDLHLVYRVDHGSNVLVVVFEQVPDQLGLLIPLHCTKRGRKTNCFLFSLFEVNEIVKKKKVKI